MIHFINDRNKNGNDCLNITLPPLITHVQSTMLEKTHVIYWKKKRKVIKRHLPLIFR